MLTKTGLKTSGAGVNVSVCDGSADKMASAAATKTVVETLYNVPNGVRMMSKEVAGLPVTSTNMGVVKTPEDRFTVNTMLRSSSRTVNDDYVDNIVTVAQMCGMRIEMKGTWLPAWPYMAKSKLRPPAKKMYKEKTGEDMREFAVHGGLELGVFSEKNARHGHRYTRLYIRKQTHCYSVDGFGQLRKSLQFHQRVY